MQILEKKEKYDRFLRLKFVYGAPALSTTHHTCLNCGNEYIGNFCNQCGQSHVVGRITFTKMLRNLMNGFTNIDRGFFFTLCGLCYSPGALIRNYIGGRRVSYFHPFQMLFIIGTIYGILIALFGHGESNPEILNGVMTEITVNGHAAIFPQHVRDAVAGIVGWLNRNVAVRTILMMPFFAYATKWAFRPVLKTENLNMAELFYIRAFVSCQYLLISLVYLPFDGFSDEGLPWWLEFLLAFWIYSGLFDTSKMRSLFLTVKMFVYSFLLLLVVCLIVGLGIGLYIRSL